MEIRPKARTEDLVVERVADELVVYDQRTQTAHALSREASAVWEGCDGSVSAAGIEERVGLERSEVERALAELRATDLLETEAIEVRSGYSRREAAVKFATVGGAAFVAPFIYSVSVASAATCACSPNAAGCHGDGFSLGMGSTNCQGVSGSGTKGTGCTCCSCTCYEGTSNNRYCVSSTCVAGGINVGSHSACSTCCSGACSGSSTTCSSGNPT